MKEKLLFIHRWLGLIVGVLIFIIALTGCLYVFKKEIRGMARAEEVTVREDGERLPLSELKARASERLREGEHIAWIRAHPDPERATILYSYDRDPEAISYFGHIEHFRSFYMNPYTGDLQAIHNEEYDFFNVMKMLHWSFLLRTPYGQPIVGWTTVIFLLLMITGLYLWWPGKKRARKRAFRFAWTPYTSTYRKNYDLHNILGFYVTSIALIMALTGMVWSFSWFEDAVYTVAAGTSERPEKEVPSSGAGKASAESKRPLQKAFEHAGSEYPNAANYRIVLPREKGQVIPVEVRQYKGAYHTIHKLWVDGKTGELLKVRDHSDKNPGERLIDANYDIHIGSILGLPGKILAFIASLLIASLPLTGFLIWLWKKPSPKKRAKQRRKRKKSVLSSS